MKIVKGAREFNIEINDKGRIEISENGEKVIARLYEGSTIIDFPNPNRAISHNGEPLTGLTITLAQSKQISAMKKEYDESRKKTEDESREIPEEIQFSINYDMSVLIRTDNVKHSFCKTMQDRGTDWLMDNAKIIGETQDGYHIYEIESIKIQKRAQEHKAEIDKKEGAIAFKHCWECGKCQIIGKISNGKTVRMEDAEYKTTKEAFDKAWIGQLRNGGVNWIKAFMASGYNVEIVAEYYCGC